jgi:putative hydrolase of the HAD superfamily
MSGGTEIVLVCDADDTLWFDHRYFAEAYSDLAQATGWQSEAVRASIEQHRTDFGEEGFAAALRRSFPLLSRPLIDEIVERFRAHPIEPLPNCRQALERLSVRRFLYTKGVCSEQERKLEISGLGGLFDRVHVVRRKSQGTFTETMESDGVRPSNVVMVGNSVRNDVLPAIAAGARAIWLDHAENFWGRDGVLPSEAFRASTWLQVEEIVCSLGGF